MVINGNTKRQTMPNFYKGRHLGLFNWSWTSLALLTQKFVPHPQPSAPVRVLWYAPQVPGTWTTLATHRNFAFSGQHCALHLDAKSDVPGCSSYGTILQIRKRWPFLISHAIYFPIIKFIWSILYKWYKKFSNMILII